MSSWLRTTLQHSSQSYFGDQALFEGEGGTIGVMPALQELFPKADFFLTGVLGPGAGEHGPNESLYLPAAKKLTCCLAEVLASHCHFS